MNQTQNIRFNNNIVDKKVVSTNKMRQTVLRRKRFSLKNRFVNAFVVSMFILSIVLTTFVLSRFLNLRIAMAAKSETIVRLERTLDKAKEKNDSLENAIDTKFDYDELFQVAVMELGMKIPTDKEIIKFEKSSGEYVRQYENIK